MSFLPHERRHELRGCEIAAQPDGGYSDDFVVTVVLSNPAHKRIQELVGSGLFGTTVSECAEQLLYERLREIEP